MFTVTTVNLTSDTTGADSSLGAAELGPLSTEEFAALLGRFQQLEARQNHDADPHILVTAAAGRFLIRTGQGKLLLYNARDTTQPYSELSASEIAAQLDRPHTAPLPIATESTADAPKSPPHYAIAFAILIAGLGLNGYTLYSVFYTESVNISEAVVLLTDPAEVATRGRDAVGSYTTGNLPGDRAITVTSDGKIQFFELGAKDGMTLNADTFKLGRHNKKFCLLTAGSGVVHIVNPDTLVYYRDTYRRAK
jgi:hypothetical protein